MSSAQPTLAKITAPRLSGIAARPRLYRALDKALDHPVTWITGPGGAGKTTLVSSYLDKHKRPTLWYRVDQGDADAGSFFYYLRQLAQQATKKGKLPPLLTPEYALGIATFSRRFFEEFFSRLQVPSVLVFDNYQDAGEQTLLHDILKSGLDAVPEGMHVIVISRGQAPEQLSRLRANGALQQIGWDELKLTQEETQALLKQKIKKADIKELTKTLYEKTEGWAAGIVLMAEHMNTGTKDKAVLKPHNYEQIFSYFAGEIFNNADKEMQDFLLNSVYLDTMLPTLTKTLTNHARAEQILDDLCRKHYFTEKHLTPEQTYIYHPLFRQFLLSVSKTVYSQEKICAIQIQAAKLLLQHGFLDDAARLFIEAEEWNLLSQLIFSNAVEMVAQGRGQSLSNWLRSIPESILVLGPWHLYWLGVCELPKTPTDAQKCFEKALEIFVRTEDLQGILLSWSGIIDSIINGWDDFSPLKDWIEWFEQRYTPSSDLINDEVEGRVAGSMLSALMIREPTNKHIMQWQERLLACRTTDLSTKLSAYIFGVNYYVWMGSASQCHALVDELKAVVALEEVPPLVIIIAQWIEAATVAWLGGNMENALKLVNNALDYADRNGIYLWHHMLYAVGAHAALTEGKPEAAEEYIDKLETTLHPSRQHGYSLYHYLRAWKCFQNNDYIPALAHAQRAYDVADVTGYIFPTMLCQLEVANILTKQNEYQKSHEILNNALPLIEATGSAYFQFSYYLAEAELNKCQNDLDSALVSLRKAMEIGKAKQLFGLIWWWAPNEMTGLFALALEHDIEPEYVRTFIRQRHLLPPQGNHLLSNWPWPVKINTLGRFEIHINDELVRFSGKIQKKPLELLKIIIASGGEHVNGDRIIDALWPDAEGDSALLSLRTNVHRLRQLLGNSDTIVYQEGRIGLNKRYCWVDVWEFGELLQNTADLSDTADPFKVKGLVESALALYAGDFLENESTMDWMLSLRERLKMSLLRAITQLGNRLEHHQYHAEAINWYESGLNIDELNEGLYQHLMRCYVTLGRNAEAIIMYKRCCQTLRRELGIAPSKETDAIAALAQ